MSDKPEASVMGSLPHSRPARRSEKRAARPEAQREDHDGVQEQRTVPRASCPASLADSTELFGTALKAAVELAEIGLTVSAHALRIAVSRLPKP